MTKTMKRLALYSLTVIIIATMFGCKKACELYWTYTMEKVATEEFEKHKEYYVEKGLCTDVLYADFGTTSNDGYYIALVMEDDTYYNVCINHDCGCIYTWGMMLDHYSDWV